MKLAENSLGIDMASPCLEAATDFLVGWQGNMIVEEAGKCRSRLSRRLTRQVVTQSAQ